MRRLLTCAVALACGCAHGRSASDSRPAYLELESDHYVLLTDLPERDAGKTLGRLENVRSALIQGSWHRDALPREKLRVVQLASSARFHEFASSGMSAFYQPVDLFGEPMLVMTADQGAAGDAILQHELAHALHGSFLPRNPRWFFEGLACYLETLRYDAAADRHLIGEPNEDRLHYLRLHQGTDYARVLSTSTREAVLLSGQDGYAFQSAAWLLVFYLANERGAALDDYIQRRARGEAAQAAFSAAFAGLDPGTLAQDAARYEKILTTAAGGRSRPGYRVREVRLPAWEGAVQVRATSPAEVEALRAELYFLSPGLPRNQAHLAEARALPAVGAGGPGSVGGKLGFAAAAREHPHSRGAPSRRLPRPDAPRVRGRSEAARRAPRRAAPSSRAVPPECDRAQRARVARPDARPRATGDPGRAESRGARARPRRGARHPCLRASPFRALCGGYTGRGARRGAGVGARERRSTAIAAGAPRRDARRVHSGAARSRVMRRRKRGGRGGPPASSPEACLRDGCGASLGGCSLAARLPPRTSSASSRNCPGRTGFASSCRRRYRCRCCRGPKLRGTP